MPDQEPDQVPQPAQDQPHPDIPVREVHEIGSHSYVVADVEPLDVTGLRTVGVGTALFLVAGLALIPFYGWLEGNGREWWLWTCAAGFGLGMFGVDYCPRRARHLRHAG